MSGKENKSANDANLFNQSLANVQFKSFNNTAVQNYKKDRIIDSTTTNNHTSVTFDGVELRQRVSQDTPILIMNNSEKSIQNKKKNIESNRKVTKSQNVFSGSAQIDENNLKDNLS